MNKRHFDLLNTPSSSESKFNQILKKFVNPADKILVVRKGTSAPEYMAFSFMGNKAMGMYIGCLNGASGVVAPEFSSMLLYNVIGAQSHNSATKTGTWSTSANASHYGGGYSSTSVTGSSITMTTNANATKIGIFDVGGVTSKIAVVEINGDKTLANELPTAQSMVTAGTLASSCLVANGGTLNPTDRILNQQTPLSAFVPDAFLTYSRRVKIASNLTPGTYSVKITNTGYNQIGGSTGTSVRIVGLYFDDPLATANSFPNAQFETTATTIFDTTSSDNDFAFNFIPSGGTTGAWMGHSGSQYLTSAQFWLDDILTASIPEFDYTKFCTNFKIVVNGYFRHTQSVPNVASYIQTATFNASTGIINKIDFTWLVAGVATGYIPQLGINEEFNRGTSILSTQNYSLSNNNETSQFNQLDAAGWLWSPTTNWGILLAVDEYQKNPKGVLHFYDRNGGLINKLYFQIYNATPIAVNDTINTTTYYRFKQFTNAELEIGK